MLHIICSVSYDMISHDSFAYQFGSDGRAIFSIRAARNMHAQAIVSGWYSQNTVVRNESFI